MSNEYKVWKVRIVRIEVAPGENSSHTYKVLMADAYGKKIIYKTQSLERYPDWKAGFEMYIKGIGKVGTFYSPFSRERVKVTNITKIAPKITDADIQKYERYHGSKLHKIVLSVGENPYA